MINDKNSLLALTLISWNVNGIRAAVKNGFTEFLEQKKPDILCLQEVKISDLHRAKTQFDFRNYTEYWNSAERPGYAGTAILVNEKLKQPAVINGLNKPEFDAEGRVQTAEFDKFYLVNTYFPHARHDLSRLDFKLKFDGALLSRIKKLEKKKPVILTGDLNVAHEEIDLANPKENDGNPGFHPAERKWMTKFLKAGFVDTFRALHPDKIQYTWWSYKFHARDRNIGWRIDYFCVSEALKKSLKQAEILDKVKGSDHCPVSITLSSRP
ncbi:MAG: exodeoxyribonuclease III [Candidatus Magasanikbacteria bacterium]|nr:exodeoxyribonuclease III [Candidatus Magasanikbacteria bacterium]